MSLRRTLTLGILAASAHAAVLPVATLAEVPEVKAVPLTAVIGTSKMEGAVSDLQGNFYFCNMAADGLDVRSRGNIGILPGNRNAEIFVELPEGMRGNGLRIGPDGNLYMADQQGGRLVRIDIETKEITVLHDFGFEGLFWNNAPNDVAFSKDGQQIYVSCMKNGVWRLDLDGSNPEQVTSAYANGLDVSPDGQRLILATGIYKINADGRLSPTDSKPELPKQGYAYTDGLRCDADGNIYISRAGAKIKQGDARVQQPGAVHVFSPEGKLIRNIIAPHERVHNVGFGGGSGNVLFLICPGDNGFIAYHTNGVEGLNQQRLRDWGLGE
ncbi:MAG: SMP-30/gluconolactonase/LRE family protein [Opitutales bacterium]